MLAWRIAQSWRIAQRLIARAISFGLTGGFTLALFGMAFGLVIGISSCASFYLGAFLLGSAVPADWFLFVFVPSGVGGVVGLVSGSASCALAACLTARVRESECVLSDVVEGALTLAARGLAVGALCGASSLTVLFFLLSRTLLPSLVGGTVLGAAGGAFVGSMIGAVRAAGHHRS